MKTRTVIVDIDGCIFEHHGQGASYQWYGGNIVLPHVREAFDAWEKESACIILMTARKEMFREELEEYLRGEKLYWDHLIMGVGHGTRVLINDAKPGGERSALAIEVPRNEGLELCINLEQLSSLSLLQP